MKACLNCPDRHEACHDRCDKPERLKEVARNLQAREARVKALNVDAFTINSVRHSVKQGGRTFKNT